MSKPSHETESTDHKGSGPLGPRNYVVRDPQGEGFIMVLIRVLLPPDFKLSDGAPAGGEADVAHLRDGDGFSKRSSEGKYACDLQGGSHLGGELPAGARPLEDHRLIGRV